jgi:predicted O-linked N-acetylglucosamine transferase (SPINDLY family)
LSDEQLLTLIQSDRVDVLVDLTGHMNRNRMLVFAQKPAPVQIGYLYPHSTGLATMDGRLTDAWVDPPGLGERFNTERLLRLPQTGWSYRPPEQMPPVSGLPASATGRITFGSVNRLLKVTPIVVETWATLLTTVPKSQLFVMAENDAGATRLRDEFARHGVSSDRILAVPRCSHRSYLQLMQRIDIALDTFPYNGQNTSYDVLLMGLPLVTLAGEAAVSRMTLGILANIGLGEFVASTREEYVRIAAELAADVGRLVQLRSTLRERVRSSPLVDERRLVSSVEKAFIDLWSAYCRG